MKLSASLQEALVALLCFNSTEKGGKLVRGIIPAASYDPFFTEIALAADSFIEKYDTVPGEHTLDIVNQLSENRPESATIYQRIYSSLLIVKDTINPDFVIGQASLFARFQRIKRGISESLDLLEKEDEPSIAEAETVLMRAIKHSNQLFDPGTNLADTKRSLLFLEREHEDAFPTGIPELDNFDLGPQRKQIHTLMAPSGRGKSWWLVNLAKHAMLARKKVVYITLELSEKLVCQRLVQSLFSLRKRDVPVHRQLFELDDLGRYVSMSEVEVAGRPVLFDAEARKDLNEKMETLKARPPILVKEFPTGYLTMRELDGYLEMLNSTQFAPDLVCLDYPDLMNYDVRYEKQELSRIWKELRGVAIQRNIGMAVVTQGNREGYDAKVLKEKHTSADISKVNTSDKFFSFNQTDQEKQLGLARLYGVKTREELGQMTVLLSQAYAIGQFSLQSVRMVKSYWGHLKATEEDNDAEQGSD